MRGPLRGSEESPDTKESLNRVIPGTYSGNRIGMESATENIPLKSKGEKAV